MHLKRWLLLLLRRDRHPRPRRRDLPPRPLSRQPAADEIPIVYWLTGAWLDAAGARRRWSPPSASALTGIGMWGLMRIGRVAVHRPQRQRHGGALHEALPGARAAHRGHRRRDRPLDAAARPEGLQRQHHRRRGGGRRRRQQRTAAPAARHRAARRHPQLHRRPGRCRAAHDPAHAVPLPGRLRASTTTPSATSSSPP